LLDAMGWPGAGLDGNEHQSRKRWEELLAEIGANDECTEVMSTAEATALLRDQADGVMFEPEELRTGLTVIDPQTCAGMSFDALWVCGLDTARWPSPASPDPFLPREWQTKKRLPGATAEIAVDEARRLLTRLCGSAEVVVLSVPRFEGEAPLLPSALIAAVPRGEPPEGWTAPVPAVAIFAARPELERLGDGLMPAVVKHESSSGGARLLEIQSACPFRAQAEFRLGARALEDSELGVAASDRGELVHAVLARLWREIGTQQALRSLAPDDLRAAIQGSIDVETAPARQSAAGFMRHLLDIEADLLQVRVQDLLSKDLERPPFSIESVEQDHAIDIGGLTLGLRVDRIDRLADGSLAVIDYKTGADAQPDSWFGERPRLPQLPLYAEAVGAGRVSAVVFGHVRTGDTGYRGIARDSTTFPGLLNPGGRGWPTEHSSWDELLHAWRRRLTALATEHAAGDASLAPDPVRACRYCDLGILCRIGETRLRAADAESGDE
jgi:probable DNA repair protein